MSRFIPKTTVAVFPETPEGLVAHLYTETPVWVVERIATSTKTAQAIYGEGVLVVRAVATQAAMGMTGLSGEGAPGDGEFPPYSRENADENAIRCRVDWLCNNLSVLAIKRIVEELVNRSRLPDDLRGN